MRTEIPRLPQDPDGMEETLDIVEVESVLVRSAYCVKEGARKAFRQQILFFVMGTSLIGAYTWTWARDAAPLVAVPLVAWLMSLWLAHRAGVREISEMVDLCLGSIEPARSSSSEDPVRAVLPLERSRVSRRT